MITNVMRRFVLPLMAVFFIAAAPMKTQAPGYFRMTVGAFEVTALNDGAGHMKLDLLHGISATELPGVLARSFTETNGNQIASWTNAFLVNTGEHLILVDTGVATCWGASGRVAENLRASGYKESDVDAVLITHLHGDHVCGLSTGGTRLFSNAIVYVSEPEGAFWLTEGPDGKTRGGADVVSALAPYKTAHAFKTFKPGDVLFPGVTALDTRGHTPGHISYLFESNGKGLLAFGDIVHAYAVQFARPEVSIDYDTDQPTAIATRKKLFEQVSAKGWAVAGVHLPFPGVGNVRKDGANYDYVPVKYRPLP